MNNAVIGELQLFSLGFDACRYITVQRAT